MDRGPPATLLRMSVSAGGQHAGQGRVVRWDDAGQRGAAVVEGVAGEVEIPAAALGPALVRPLEPGELVDLRWDDGDPEGGIAARATSATPTDG